MAKVETTVDLPVPAQRVWALIGTFGGISNWHPAVEKATVGKQGDDTVRTLHLVGGGRFIEKLEHVSPGERHYSYTILSGPLPVADYHSVLRVREREGGGCTVEWSSEFTPSGASEDEAASAVRAVYTAGFENLRKMLGA